MALLVASQFARGRSRGWPIALLLAATAILGIGFGLTVPALNTPVAASLSRRESNGPCSSLNALLGLGTALAPVFVAIFVGPRRLVGFAARRRRCCSLCSSS